MAQIITSVSGSDNSILNTDGSQKTEPIINPAGYYNIDFRKLTKVDDLILILDAVGFNFSPSHPHFERLKPFLDYTSPQIPNPPSQSV
jgi:hypothetical protein